MQAHCLHLFHVIHTHGHIRLLDPSPKDIVAILMTSLIGTLNLELPSQLWACTHSHDIHMEVESDIVITMFPFYTITTSKKTLLPQPPWNITQLINTIWAIVTMPKVTESTNLASIYIYMSTIHHWMSIWPIGLLEVPQHFLYHIQDQHLVNHFILILTI